MVGTTLGSTAGDCVLEFLRILPEEVTEGRKINLSVGNPLTHPGAQSAKLATTILPTLDCNLIILFIRKRTLQQGPKNFWKIIQTR